MKKNVVLWIYLLIISVLPAKSQELTISQMLDHAVSMGQEETTLKSEEGCWEVVAAQQDGARTDLNIRLRFWGCGLFFDYMNDYRGGRGVSDPLFENKESRVLYGLWEFKHNNMLTFKTFTHEIGYEVIVISENKVLLKQENGDKYLLSRKKKRDFEGLWGYSSMDEEQATMELSEIQQDWDRCLHTIVAAKNFSEGVAAVTIIPPRMINGKVGYINRNGEYIVLPIYAEGGDFHNGYALVKEDKGPYENGFHYHYSFINTKGENVFGKHFYDARDFKNGLAAVKSGSGKWGLLNDRGELITDYLYDEVKDVNEGVACVQYKGLWGYINAKGDEIVRPQFIQAHDMSDGLAYVVTTNQMIYYIDSLGNKLFEFKGDSWSISANRSGYGNFRDGEAILAHAGTVGLVRINRSGQVLNRLKNIPHLYAQNNPPLVFNEGYAVLYGRQFIDKQGRIYKASFDAVSPFHEGLASVRIGGNWGFVDTSLRVVINPSIIQESGIQKNDLFERVSNFSEGYAAATVKGKVGFINKQGEWAIPPTFKVATSFHNGFSIVKHPDKKGLNFINNQGEMLLKDYF